MKTLHKQPLRLLVLVSAVVSICHQAYAAVPTASPFAPVPLHLQNVDTKVQGNVKPNVMLLLDDSGSMSTPVGRGQNRLTTVQYALDSVLNTYRNKINWNFASLWTFPFPLEKYTDYRKMKARLRLLRAANGTPTTQRYVNLLGTVLAAQQYRCQKSFIVLLSDGDANNNYDRDQYGRIFRDETQIALTKLVNNFNPLIAKKFKSLFGDRLPQDYIAAGPQAADVDGYCRYYYGDPLCSYGNLNNGISYFSRKLYETDLKTSADGVDIEGGSWDDPAFPKQNIETFTVGFGGDMSSRGRMYLRYAAAANTTAYFRADTPDSLVDAFDKIFKEIDKVSNIAAVDTSSIASPSNSSSKVEGLAALLSLDMSVWGSNLKFYVLNKSTGEPTGEVQSPDYQGRKIIYSGVSGNSWLVGAPYQEFGFSSEEEFKKGFFPWLLRDPSVTDEQIESNVAKLKGITRTVSKYRVRTKDANDDLRQMGDVLDANVLSIGKNAKYVVTGANDGMLYFFKSTGNSKKPYNLILNYLPGGLPREWAIETLAKSIPTIAEANYGQPANPHIYGVNGGMTYATTFDYDGRGQQTIMLANLGQGARGSVALNVSGCDDTVEAKNCIPVGLDSQTWLKSVPLWETEKGVLATMGYTISTPVLYPVASKWSNKTADAKTGLKMGAFIANGYRANNDALNYDTYPTLYIYDALGQEIGTGAKLAKQTNKAGNLIKKISVNGNRNSALASPTVVDNDLDGIADVAYAGDSAGDLYRFDLRGEPSKWKAVKIYDGKETQPITAAPAVYRNALNNYVVVFGTGSDIKESDKSNQEQQIFAGVYDDLTVPSPTAISQTKGMLEQKLTANSAGQRFVSNNLLASQTGWYIKLAKGSIINNKDGEGTISSEQVVTKPYILQKTAFFTTRVYSTVQSSNGVDISSQTCNASVEVAKTSGSSWLMAIDVTNGGAPTTSKLNTGDKNKKISTKENFAGYNLGEGVLASAVVVFDNSAIGGEQSALSDNGEAQSGTLSVSGETQVRDNQCVSGENYNIYVATTDKANPLLTQGISTEGCNERLIRMNSRIIRENLN